MIAQCAVECVSSLVLEAAGFAKLHGTSIGFPEPAPVESTAPNCQESLLNVPVPSTQGLFRRRQPQARTIRVVREVTDIHNNLPLKLPLAPKPPASKPNSPKGKTSKSTSGEIVSLWQRENASKESSCKSKIWTAVPLTLVFVAAAFNSTIIMNGTVPTDGPASASGDTARQAEVIRAFSRWQLGERLPQGRGVVQNPPNGHWDTNENARAQVSALRTFTASQDLVYGAPQLSVVSGELLRVLFRDASGWTLVSRLTRDGLSMQQGWVPDWALPQD
eukprot:gnl/MRDRNA2_/MRDRNA2_75710_c1_seq1.p1 gnl/MRDRNA2_/MRDRNA2_75710_c1~~gnl/MRDRNA2_/MRDRNA2_75710_c1_seq1.p1  ORF type:complete len:310 (+),score=34.36 gnl/MRDRNA2_/MRDRNA2_75710_c1_seq1:105-932(+)